MKVPASEKRSLERAVVNCGYFLEKCSLNSRGMSAIFAAGQNIMCSTSSWQYDYSYLALSTSVPRKSWATMLVQFKLAWVQKASEKRVTVEVDGRFRPVTRGAWNNAARYTPVRADGAVSGKGDWVCVFMFYCGN